MKEDVDVNVIYDMISIIPVPKETFEAMCFQMAQKEKEIRRLKAQNVPIEPFVSEAYSYPKQNKTYYCGDCGKRIAKGDKYCRDCGRAVCWK